jgi:hypothetical protein
MVQDIALEQAPASTRNVDFYEKNRKTEKEN